MRIRKAGFACISLILVALWSAAAAHAEIVDSGLPERSKDEIIALWRSYQPDFAEDADPFAEEPSTKAPYRTGKLKQNYVQGGVSMANFYRYVSGLPNNLLFDAALSEQAQFGAVLIAANHELNHRPGKPSDMPNEFYDKGFESASSSNLASMSPGSARENLLSYTVKMYMSDSDATNIDRVGHRRWILSPQLQKVGFGLAVSNREMYYSPMQVFDSSGQKHDYQYVAFPGTGHYPAELIAPTDAWSVQLNPDKFGKLDASRIQVHISRIGDGKAWSLSSADRIADSDSEALNKPYFNVETTRYGSSSAVIFRPGHIDGFHENDRYLVKVTGLTHRDGTEASIEYEVNFFELTNASDAVTNEDPMESKLSTSFRDINGHWAENTIMRAAAAQIVTGYPDRTFKPDRPVSEAEFLTLFFKGIQGYLPEAEPGKHWSSGAYQAAYRYRYPVSLESEGKQDALINRSKVAEIIAGADGLHFSGNDAIQYVLAKGYSSGKTAKSVEGYQGSDSLTRAEALQFIFNLKDNGLQKLQVRPAAESPSR